MHTWNAHAYMQDYVSSLETPCFANVLRLCDFGEHEARHAADGCTGSPAHTIPTPKLIPWLQTDDDGEKDNTEEEEEEERSNLLMLSGDMQTLAAVHPSLAAMSAIACDAGTPGRDWELHHESQGSPHTPPPSTPLSTPHRPPISPLTHAPIPAPSHTLRPTPFASSAPATSRPDPRPDRLNAQGTSSDGSHQVEQQRVTVQPAIGRASQEGKEVKAPTAMTLAELLAFTATPPSTPGELLAGHVTLTFQRWLPPWPPRGHCSNAHVTIRSCLMPMVIQFCPAS